MTDADKVIQLDQFLKLKGLVATGGEAKYLIQSGQVRLNQEVETRSKKKIKPGDLVEIHGQTITAEWD
jgi:ribosome-associated protein